LSSTRLVSGELVGFLQVLGGQEDGGAASGQTARKRDPSTRVDLTPQQLQVAQLVAEGHSNREAAARLFVSPRTVDFHLRNLFTKLGITSRVEFARLDLGNT
jgi:DNA-binding CsgD family transcriptional regulator